METVINILKGGRLWPDDPLASTVARLAFLRRNGRRITAATYQGVAILEPATDRMIEHLPAPGAIAGLAVAPAGAGSSAAARTPPCTAGDPGRQRLPHERIPHHRLPPRVRARRPVDGLRRRRQHRLPGLPGAGPTGREALLAEDHAAAVIWLY